MLNGTAGLAEPMVQVTDYFAGGKKKRNEIRPAATECDCACDDCFCLCNCKCACTCQCNCECVCECNCKCECKGHDGYALGSVTLDTTLGDPKGAKLGSSEHDSKHNSEFSPQEESIGGTKFDGKHDLKGNKGSAALFDVDSLDQFGE